MKIRTYKIFFLFSILMCSCMNNETDPQTLKKQAIQDYNAGNYKDGLVKIKKAMKTGTIDAELYVIKGILEEEILGNRKNIIENYFQALRYNPKYTPAYFYLGLNCSNAKMYDSAIYYYDKAYNSLSKDGIVFNLIHETKTDSLVIYPKQIYYQRGVCFYEKDNWYSALFNFKESLKANFNVGLSNLYIGVICLNLNDKNSACEYLHNAIKNGEQGAETYIQQFCN